MLPALKRNSSLWEVTAAYMQNWLEANTTKLEFYAKRNKQIFTILDSPEDKVQQATLATWPSIFRAVRGCEMEPSVIFAGLMALGSACGPSALETKKRQRKCLDKEEVTGNEVVLAGPMKW